MLDFDNLEVIGLSSLFVIQLIELLLFLPICDTSHMLPESSDSNTLNIFVFVCDDYLFPIWFVVQC